MKSLIYGCILTLILLSPFSSFADENVFNVGKTPAGSTTDGIQEAIDKAKTAGGGIIQLACNTTYTITTSGGTWLNFNGVENVLFKGCGNNTKIEAIGDFKDIDYTGIGIYGGSSHVRFEDFHLFIQDTCSVGDCNTNNGWNDAIGFSGSSDHVDFYHVRITHIVHKEDATVTDAPSVRAVMYNCTSCWDFSFKDSVFVTSGRAIEILNGDNIDLSGNHISGPSGADDQGITYGIIKYGSALTLVEGNQIDLGNSQTATSTSGITLLNEIAGPVGRFAQVKNNRIIELQSGSNQYGIRLAGYNNANITGNLVACEVTSGCLADGVSLQDASDCTDCNRGNIINSNIFYGFDDDDSNGPIKIASSTDDNRGNIISNNVFQLDNATDDGLSGDSSLFSENNIHDNSVTDK